MGVRRALKRSDTFVGLVHDLTKILRVLGIAAKLSRRSRIMKRYLASNEMRKLIVGAGRTFKDDWLCSDIKPKSANVMYLNAAKKFPFDDNTFDYIYTEHMIEHISWAAGMLMLKECQRVIKPGGTIRIATPDLGVLIGLYRRNGDPLNERYINWITNKFLTDIHVNKASFVINNAFRNWGHQFLYDGELMEMAMQEAGFVNIQRCNLGESADKNLRGMEAHGENVEYDEMVVFETMVYEGKRPA